MGVNLRCRSGRRQFQPPSAKLGVGTRNSNLDRCGYSLGAPNAPEFSRFGPKLSKWPQLKPASARVPFSFGISGVRADIGQNCPTPFGRTLELRKSFDLKRVWNDKLKTSCRNSSYRVPADILAYDNFSQRRFEEAK